ncbi:Crp/Fnr family transcriptional regulator [Microbaculum marinum]|uniref:Crp/Fnr family transcriptional regulator n=1 Tax=Microbaculum marinum TaxID=1764581 RepID=A0AAW9RVK2_9HYPH
MKLLNYSATPVSQLLPTGAAAPPRRYPRLLEMLPPQDREFLLDRAIERTLAKGQVPYHQGDESRNLFVLKSGIVKVHYTHDSGTSLTASHYREGMLIGAHGCSEWAGPHVWSAQALVESRAIWMRRADLLELVDRSPAALRCILAITEFKSVQLRKVIRILATPLLESRITMALEHLGSLYGIERDGEVEIDGRFTHQELAEMVGCSRQSVTTALQSLERAGRLRRDGRQFFIRRASSPDTQPQPLRVPAE